MTKEKFNTLFKGLNRIHDNQKQKIEQFMINEALIEPNMYCKEYSVSFDPKTENVLVMWFTQNKITPHAKFSVELLRVFKKEIKIKGHIYISLIEKTPNTDNDFFYCL